MGLMTATGVFSMLPDSTVAGVARCIVGIRGRYPRSWCRRRVGGAVGSVRGTQLHVSRLDDIVTDLLVEATCITRSENNILYQFSISAEGHLLLDGRAAVVLNADVLTPTSGDAP